MLLKCQFNSIGEFNMLPTEENYNQQKNYLKKALILKKSSEKDFSFVLCLKDARKIVTTGNPSKYYSKINRFEFLVYIGEDIYNYGFKVNGHKIEEEWLYAINEKGSFDKIFDFNKKKSDKLFLYRLAKEYDFRAAKNIISWFKNIEIFSDCENCDLVIIKDADSKAQQILFESTNADLLDYRHFNHDEIWFIRRLRNFTGERIDLYPLSDFDFRPQIDIKKDYMAGRYGV